MEIDREGFPGRRHRFEPWSDHRMVSIVDTIGRRDLSSGALNAKLRSGVNLRGNRETHEQESYMIRTEFQKVEPTGRLEVVRTQ